MFHFPQYLGWSNLTFIFFRGVGIPPTSDVFFQGLRFCKEKQPETQTGNPTATAHAPQELPHWQYDKMLEMKTQVGLGPQQNAVELQALERPCHLEQRKVMKGDFTSTTHGILRISWEFSDSSGGYNGYFGIISSINQHLRRIRWMIPVRSSASWLEIGHFPTVPKMSPMFFKVIPIGELTKSYWKWPSRNSGFSHWKWWIFP